MNTKDHDTSLMTLNDLQERLKDIGVVEVPKKTFRNWCFLGVKTSTGQIKLRSRKIGKKRMSSVKWFWEFLDAQD